MILAELALTPPYYLVLSALMFAVGATGLLIRRNGLELFRQARSREQYCHQNTGHLTHHLPL